MILVENSNKCQAALLGGKVGAFFMVQRMCPSLWHKRKHDYDEPIQKSVSGARPRCNWAPVGNGQWAGSERESCYLIGSEITRQGHDQREKGQWVRGGNL